MRNGAQAALQLFEEDLAPAELIDDTLYILSVFYFLDLIYDSFFVSFVCHK